MSPEKTASEDCKRFLGVHKRIPKDVRRHCGMCRQHGTIVETRGHVCPLRACSCDKCSLIRERRLIMSTQIRLRRQQDRRFQRTQDAEHADLILDKQDLNTMNTCYVCQKCKNHGILKWKKDHKKRCTYAECPCAQCKLIDTRRALDRTIKGEKRVIREETTPKKPRSPKISPDENINATMLLRLKPLPSTEVKLETGSMVDIDHCKLQGFFDNLQNMPIITVYSPSIPASEKKFPPNSPNPNQANGLSFSIEALLQR